MSLLIGTDDGVWELAGSMLREAGMRGERVSHVAKRGPIAVACVPHDGLYSLSEAGFKRIWEGDARACNISPDGTIYAGAEPAMVHWSHDGGRSWSRADAIDDLPTRKDWYFPPPPHEPHVRSIDFLVEEPGTVFAGVEVGGFLVSRDGGRSWDEKSKGLNVDVHHTRQDRSDPARIYAVTGGGFHASEDGGNSWERRMSGIDRWYTAGLAVGEMGELICAAGDRPPGMNGRLYQSGDGGRSWTVMRGTGLPEEFSRVPVPLLADGRLWIGSPDGRLFRGDASGASLFELAATLPSGINALAADGVSSSVDSGH